MMSSLTRQEELDREDWSRRAKEDASKGGDEVYPTYFAARTISGLYVLCLFTRIHSYFNVSMLVSRGLEGKDEGRGGGVRGR